MRIKKRNFIGLMLSAILCVTCVSDVKATTADYYDVGFMKYDGEYVNRIGEKIPDVISRGIDVSSYQGTINWAEVAKDDVSFAFIRCGNTKSGPDLMFDYNVMGALNNGIEVGIYYVSFAPNEAFARMEANYAVACAQKYNITLPVVYDIEGSTMASLGNIQLKKNLDAFCEVVRNAGYTPMLYASRDFIRSYLPAHDCDTWVARYYDYCDYAGKKRFWQCSSHGYVKGIEGRVDIDFKYY